MKAYYKVVAYWDGMTNFSEGLPLEKAVERYRKLARTGQAFRIRLDGPIMGGRRWASAGLALAGWAGRSATGLPALLATQPGA